MNENNQLENAPIQGASPLETVSPRADMLTNAAFGAAMSDTGLERTRLILEGHSEEEADQILGNNQTFAQSFAANTWASRQESDGFEQLAQQQATSSNAEKELKGLTPEALSNPQTIEPPKSPFLEHTATSVAEEVNKVAKVLLPNAENLFADKYHEENQAAKDAARIDKLATEASLTQDELLALRAVQDKGYTNSKELTRELKGIVSSRTPEELINLLGTETALTLSKDVRGVLAVEALKNINIRNNILNLAGDALLGATAGFIGGTGQVIDGFSAFWDAVKDEEERHTLDGIAFQTALCLSSTLILLK